MKDANIGRFLTESEDGVVFTLGGLKVIASWGADWEHVSVSVNKRLPTYAEMIRVKRFCFKADEYAVEYHVPVKNHININPCVLHLWRPTVAVLPVPPEYMV